MTLPETPMSLLVKLGSIAVHADELLSPAGHHFDRTALEMLLLDPEVTQWLFEMDALAMLPKKRMPADAALAAKRKSKVKR